MTSSEQRFRLPSLRWAAGWTTFWEAWTDLLIALLVFAILDYITGVMRAIVDNKDK